MGVFGEEMDDNRKSAYLTLGDLRPFVERRNGTVP